MANVSGPPPPPSMKRVYRSNSAGSTSPASSSGVSAYSVGGSTSGTVLVASLLQQLQGVLYSYEVVVGNKLRPPPVSSLASRHVTSNDVVRALSTIPASTSSTSARPKPVSIKHAPEEIECTIWKIAEWLRRLVEARQTTVTEVMETLRQAEVWISSLEHHHHGSSGSTTTKHSKHSKTTQLIFRLLLPVLVSVQKRYVLRWEGGAAVMMTTGDDGAFALDDDYERVALTETGTLQLDWCLDAAVHEGEQRNSALAYGMKLAHEVVVDDDAGGGASNAGAGGAVSGMLFGTYMSPKEIFGADMDDAGVRGNASLLERISGAHVHDDDDDDDNSSRHVHSSDDHASTSTAGTCLELLSATSLPLMVERLMGRLQAFPLHLTLLHVSSSWHFTVINTKQRNATVAYLTGVCEHVIKHVERGAQRRTVMNILAKVFARIRAHAHAHAREWLRIPTRDLESFWIVQQRIYAQARKWGRRKNSRIEAASLMQQLVSFSRLGTSQLKQRVEVLDMLRNYAETMPALRPASLQLIARFMTAMTSSGDIFETLPSDVWQRDFSRFLLLVCPGQPKREPSVCEVLPSAGVIAAAARSSGEKALDGIKRLLTTPKFPKIYRTLGLSALAIIVNEWRIDETLKRKADELGAIVCTFLGEAESNASHAIPALRCLRLLLQMEAPGVHRVIEAVGRLVASTSSSMNTLSRVAYQSVAACLAWIPRTCLITALHFCVKALGRDPMCSQRKFIDLINASRSILRRIVDMIELSASDVEAATVVVVDKSFRSTWVPLRLKIEGAIILSMSRQEEAPLRTATFELLYLLSSEQLRRIECAEPQSSSSVVPVAPATAAPAPRGWSLRSHADAFEAVQELATTLKRDASSHASASSASRARTSRAFAPFLADTLEPLLDFVKRCVTPPEDVCDGALMAILTGDGLTLHQTSVQWAWRRLTKISVWGCIPTDSASHDMWKRMITIVFTPMRANRRSPRLTSIASSLGDGGGDSAAPLQPVATANELGSASASVAGSNDAMDSFVDASVSKWMARNRMNINEGVPLAVSGAWKVSQMAATPVACSEALVLALSNLDVSLTDILVLELRSSANTFDSSSPRAPSRRSTLRRRASKLSVWEQEIQLAESIRNSFHYNINVLSVLANIFSRLSAGDYWSDEIALHRASRTCLEELVGIWLKQTSADVLRHVPIRTRIAIMTLVRCYLRFIRMKPSSVPPSPAASKSAEEDERVASTASGVLPQPALASGAVAETRELPDSGGSVGAGGATPPFFVGNGNLHDTFGRRGGRERDGGGSEAVRDVRGVAVNGDASVTAEMTPSQIFAAQHPMDDGPFEPPSLEYRESIIRAVSELWAVGPHIDIDSSKKVCEADENLVEQLMEGVLSVYEAVVCLGAISDVSLRERIHSFIRKQILTSSRRETQAAASLALTFFLIHNPSHLSHFVVGSLDVLRKHASWSAGTELEQTLVYEHLRAIVRAAQAGKLTSSWSDTGTGYALLLLHLSAPILRHRRAALDLLSVLQRHDMMEDRVHQKGVSLQSARAAMLDSEYVSDAAYVEGSAIIADLISQMRPELAPAVLRELVRMQRLFSPQILPSLLAVAIPWANALKDLISPRAPCGVNAAGAAVGGRRGGLATDAESRGFIADGGNAGGDEMESVLTEEAQEVLDSAFALTSGCGIPPRHSGMLRSLWTGMINNSGHSGGAAAAKVLVDFLLQLHSMSSRNGRSWHEDGDTASVVLTLLLHSPMAMSIVRFLVLNLPHYGLDSSAHAAMHDHGGERPLSRVGVSTRSAVAVVALAAPGPATSVEDGQRPDVALETAVREDSDGSDGKDSDSSTDDDDDDDDSGSNDGAETSRGGVIGCSSGEALSVVTTTANSNGLESSDCASAIWGGVRELRSFDANSVNEKAGVVFFLLKAAAHTHAKLMVPQLHFILHYAAVQTYARPENGHEAAVFLIRVLHLLVLRSKLRSGTEELAWSFIKSYLNDLWGSDDRTKNEQLDSSTQSLGLEAISTSLEFRFTSTVVMRLAEALDEACPTLKWSWNVLALAGATHAETRPEVLAGLTVFAGLGGAQTLDQLMQLARVVHAGVLTDEEEVVVKAVEGLSETFHSDTQGALVANGSEEQILQIRPFWDLALGIAVALLTSGSMRLYGAAARLALRLLRLTHIRTQATSAAATTVTDGENFTPTDVDGRVRDGDHDADGELALAPQDTRLVVMFGICPVVSIPPDVLLATIVERGLFSLFPGGHVGNVPTDADTESSSLAIHVLREMWDVSSEAGDVDNYLMVLEIVVTSLRIVENLFRHSKTIKLSNTSSDEKRTSNALRRAGDAARDAVALITRSGFAMDDMTELFTRTSACASHAPLSSPSLSPAAPDAPDAAMPKATSGSGSTTPTPANVDIAKAPSAAEFCDDFIRALCLSLPQPATWRYILTVLLQMVQSGPQSLQYPSLVMIPIVLREKMHLWSTDDFTTIASTLHTLGRRMLGCARRREAEADDVAAPSLAAFSRAEVSYHIDSIRLLLFTHAEKSQAIDAFNVMKEFSGGSAGTRPTRGGDGSAATASSGRAPYADVALTPSEFSYKRRGGHTGTLDDCSRSIWENFVFAVTENGDHVCTPTYKPKYFGFAERERHPSDIGNGGTVSPSGTMDSSRHNSLYNSSSVGADDVISGNSKENSIRERSDSNTGEFDTPSTAVKGAYPYGGAIGGIAENTQFPHVDNFSRFVDDDDDDVYEMESALGRAPA